MKVNKYIFIIGGIIFLAGVFLFVSKNGSKNTIANEVVITPTAFMKLSQASDVDTSSWEMYEDKKLKFTMNHPASVIIDPRQTSKGRITAFIFEEDKDKPLPGNVTVLYIADTGKKGSDGFSAFRKGDCGTDCKVSYKNVSWININNAYGVKNPMPNDVVNYFLTDKDQSKPVINFYAGGYMKKEKDVQEKINTFEQMIKTMKFEK
jgi:hypothetical protein